MIDFMDPMWIAVVTAGVSVLVTVTVFIILFVKDKKRSAEIASLFSISKLQEEMNNNLIAQIARIQKRTLELVESNSLFKQQLTSSQKYHITEAEIFEENPDITKTEISDDIKPQFAFDGSTGNRKTHKVKIKNKGQTAYNVRITYPKNESIEFTSMNSNIDKVDTDCTFALEGKIISRVLLPQYTIQIEFEDKDKKKYSQTLSTMKMDKDVSQPVEVNN